MADRYWVGGTGSWDATTTHWSATSGGAGGASVPTSADNVFFDSASNATSYTVTVAVASSCANLSIAAPASGSVTWAGSLGLSIYGDMTIAATGVIRTYSGSIAFRATVAGKTINTNGVSLVSNLNFTGVGGTWALQGALTTSASRTVTLSDGTLDLNGFSLTCGLFASSGTTARGIAFGSGSITVIGAGIIWNTAAAGMTTTGTQLVNISNPTATAATVSCGLLSEANAISFNITTGTYSLTLSSGSKRNLNFSGFAGTVSNGAQTIYGNLTIASAATYTGGANAWTFAATSGTKTITTNGETLGFPLIFNGVGGRWALQDALTMGSTIDVAIT
ncbi:MAG: hypothetical protein ACOYBR_10255, partial [Fluviibacter sp.]